MNNKYLRRVLPNDITVVDLSVENDKLKETEILIKAGTEVMFDPSLSIASTGDLNFDIDGPSEYSHIN